MHVIVGLASTDIVKMIDGSHLSVLKVGATFHSHLDGTFRLLERTREIESRRTIVASYHGIGTVDIVL